MRGESGYVGVFCWGKKKKKQVVEHQKVTANHKKQASQVNDFSAYMTRCKHSDEQLPVITGDK